MSRPSSNGSGQGSGRGSGQGKAEFGKAEFGKAEFGQERIGIGAIVRSFERTSSAPRPSSGRSTGAAPRATSGRPSSSRGTSQRVGQRTGAPSGAASGAKGLGGRQVEGRQAVRELLMAERRKIHEIWVSAELEGDAGVEDIVEIAAARRVPLRYVAKGKLEHEARTDAPQGSSGDGCRNPRGRSR